MIAGAGLAAAARRLGHFHEDPAVIAGWQAWTRPLLTRLTPGRRRALLALAALYVTVKRPLRDMAPAVDLRSPGGPPAAAVVILLCLAVVIAAYVAARRFPSLPAAVRARPQIWLHALFWALVLICWLRPPGSGASGAASVILPGLVLALPFLLWRIGYLLMSGQRGRVAGTRLSDHLLYCYPAYGGTNTPYGKGIDHLARHEARSDEALARSQLAGLKLLALAWIYDRALELMAGLVHGEPGGLLGGYGLGLPRLDALMPAGEPAPWLTAWATVYAGLVSDVLELAVRGHEIVGVLRLFGFNIFRNTYKPLLAPSLVEFWNRYHYYFKELLVEFFFFPTYVRRFRGSPRLRMLAATFAAAGFGNLYYHLLQQDPFLLTGSWTAVRPWLETRSVYCGLLALGIYVSMRREQRRRGATAAAPASTLIRLRRIAGVWTFFALIGIWGETGTASFGQRALFVLGLFGLR
ncbi:MAG: hypothetical protein ACRELW_09120 [Candidatus Rokuibacteriota bacterium]